MTDWWHVDGRGGTLQQIFQQLFLMPSVPKTGKIGKSDLCKEHFYQHWTSEFLSCCSTLCRSHLITTDSESSQAGLYAALVSVWQPSSQKGPNIQTCREGAGRPRKQIPPHLLLFPPSGTHTPPHTMSRCHSYGSQTHPLGSFQGAPTDHS